MVSASEIALQLFNDIEDMKDDEIITWSIDNKELKKVPLSEQLIEFFMDGNPHIKKGQKVEAFQKEAFIKDNLVYSMFVHNQPIGFMRFELNSIEELVNTKRIIGHVVDIFTKAIEQMTRNRLFHENYYRLRNI